MPTYRKAEVKKSRAMWPVYGILMMVAAGGIAVVFAPEVYRILDRNPNFDIGTFSPSEVRLFIGVVLFFIVVAISGLIIAMFMPKRRDDQVKDANLKKERDALVKEEKARRIRRSVIEHEIKKNNKRLS